MAPMAAEIGQRDGNAAASNKLLAASAAPRAHSPEALRLSCRVVEHKIRGSGKPRPIAGEAQRREPLDWRARSPPSPYSSPILSPVVTDTSSERRFLALGVVVALITRFVTTAHTAQRLFAPPTPTTVTVRRRLANQSRPAGRSGGRLVAQWPPQALAANSIDGHPRIVSPLCRSSKLEVPLGWPPERTAAGGAAFLFPRSSSRPPKASVLE
jgi:hypothetical protein